MAESLRERILTGEFPPGASLTSSEQLADEYGVSRLTLREAVNILEADGLLRVRRGPGGGAFVQAPDTHAITRALESLMRFERATVEQLIDVRLVIEPYAASLAAASATDVDVEHMRESVNRMRESLVQSSESAAVYDDWFAENLYFHSCIARAAQNPVVRVLCESLHGVVGSRGVKIRRSERLRSVEEHEEILRLIMERNALGAADAVRAHIERSLYLRRKYL